MSPTCSNRSRFASAAVSRFVKHFDERHRLRVRAHVSHMREHRVRIDVSVDLDEVDSVDAIPTRQETRPSQKPAPHHVRCAVQLWAVNVGDTWLPTITAPAGSNPRRSPLLSRRV